MVGDSGMSVDERVVTEALGYVIYNLSENEQKVLIVTKSIANTLVTMKYYHFESNSSL